ncbi:MAG TPA: ParB/RepB/Spo0J family partition protein [Terriglobia bacterium]|nr:ParB/RepB/Spo0J family partition protein [Terriglobia bacterium]
MTRKALGKGLSALLQERETGADNELRELDLDLLTPNPYQPRQVFSEAKLDELAQSIRVHGFVQPLVVRRVGDRFQIVAGERRWRAAQRLGLLKVPAVIKRITDGELMETSLVENIQRENLNPIEEASAYHRLTHEFHLTQEAVAQRTGKDRTTITNVLRLLKLPKDVQRLVLEEKLSMGHARALLALELSSEQKTLAEKIVGYGWSVRQVERAVSARRTETPHKSEPPRQDPNVRAAVEKLERALGTKVRIVEKGQRGRIEIEFYSPEELQRLYEYLVRGEEE